MPITNTLISAQTVSSATSYIEFTTIPATYTHLKVIASARNSSTDTGLFMTFNSSSSNYVNQRIYGVGTGTASADTSGTNSIYMIGSNDSSYTAGLFSNTEFNILRYADAVTKQVISLGFTENIATTALGMINTARWSDNTAISTIRLTAGAGNFVTGSSFYLYGI